MHGQLPLNALRAFEVAARHMSFTKAAEELNVTPAAISQQVKSLESYLGTPLFRRLSRGLALTKSAQDALPALHQGFTGVAEGMQRLRSHSSLNRLDVWMAPSFASKWLMPRLNRFTNTHPDVDLRVTASGDLIDTDGNGALDQARHFHEQGIDVAVRFGDGNYPGCRVDKLMPATVVPLCSPQLLQDEKKPLRAVKDLLGHTLLHDDTSYEGRPSWKQWLNRAGVNYTDGTRGLHFNHVSLALEAACDSQGVVLSIEQLASADIQEGRLVVPFDLRIELSCAYYIISLAETADEQSLSDFRAWLLAESEGMQRGTSPEPPLDMSA